MKKGNLYTLCYAWVLGAASAVLLTATAQFTGPYKEANAMAEKVAGVLAVLGVRVDPDAAPRDLLDIFEANVQSRKVQGHEVYIYQPGPKHDSIDAVVVSFEGSGLWGPIKGFLAMENDYRTIRGLTFYQQEETPGLGGEIGEDWFLGQFAGKPIVDESGNPGFAIGGAAAANRVDAITGATMTCEKVQAMLSETVAFITEQLSDVR